jgi:hypothetical protein
VGHTHSQDITEEGEHRLVGLTFHWRRRYLYKKYTVFKADHLISLRVWLDPDSDSGRFSYRHVSSLPAEEAAGVFGGLLSNCLERDAPDSG